MYYSSDDIAIQAITEIPEIIDLIVNNYFEIVDLTAINIDIEIDTKKKICRVEEVVLENSSIKPGDYLEAKIKIRPFRGDLIEKTLTIHIPSDTPPGEALLMVNGGGELNNYQEEFVNSDKQDCKSLGEIFKNISDRPMGNQIIAYTLEKFEKCKLIDKIYLVVSPEEKEICHKNIILKYNFSKVQELVDGGETRQDSIYNGLKALDKDADIVVIHDGARPLVEESIIQDSIEKAQEYGAAITVIPIKDTVKKL